MKKYFISTILMLLTLVVAMPVFAATIDVNNGNDLNFGTLTENDVLPETLDVFIESDGNPYKIYYQVVQNFVNTNNVLMDQDALTFHTVAGSNNNGTLFQTNDAVLQSGQVQIFQSNASGSNASFDVMYTAHGPEANRGMFHGVIKYIMKEGNVTVEEVFLDVFIDFDINLVVTVQGSSGNDLVHMTYNGGGGPHKFTINFDGNNGGDIVKIYQDFDHLPQKSNGTLLPANAVKFKTAGGAGGTKYYTTLSNLTVNNVLLYQSFSNTQSSSLDVVFEFDPNNMGNVLAGTYTSTITFKVDWAGELYEFDVQFEVEVPTIFELNVNTTACNTPQTPDGAFSFGSNLVAGSSNKEFCFWVGVNNNTGDDYFVKHKLMAPLTNAANGFQVPNNLLKFKGQLQSGAGSIPTAYLVFAQVPVNTLVNFFQSNSTGSQAQFVMTYRLALAEATAGIKGGDYRADFQLTLVPN